MKSQEATIEWVDDGTGKVPVFFDRRKRLIDPPHDYIATVADRKRLAGSVRAYASTVESASYALLGWFQHLEGMGANWRSANDRVIKEYRKVTLKNVLTSSKSKGDERLAKRTINVRLQWIYRFYCWAQQEAALCVGIIGPRQPIESTITQTKPSERSRRRKGNSENLELYPSCYTGVSGGAGGTQYFAKSEDKQRISELFARSSDPMLVERNRIMLELSDRVGWRAGTLTALLIDDFNDRAIAVAGEEGVTVTPSVQKFAYRNPFLVPHTLVARIVRFTEMRKRWLAKHEWSESHAQRRLFLNTRTGRPLGDRTIVHIFGDAFRAIGVPSKMGAGHHSFRRKFTDETTSDDLDARRAMGLSTSVEDVMHATSIRLGQHNIASQTPYQRAVRDGTRGAESNRLRRQVQELESSVADRDVKIAELERALQIKLSGATKKRASKRAPVHDDH